MEAKGEPAQDTVKERAKEMLRRSMQPLMLDALADPKTVELILNADGKLWLERLGERMICIGKVAQAGPRRSSRRSLAIITRK